MLEAENGLQAIEMLNSNSVQLVILDVMMPKMDGIKTCLKIRETSGVINSRKGQSPTSLQRWWTAPFSDEILFK